MSNTFKQDLNYTITSQIVNDIVDEVQKSCSFNKPLDDSNLYDFLQQLESFSNINNQATNRHFLKNDGYSIALKIFLQKFIADNQKNIENLQVQILQKQKEDLGLKTTGNQNYMVDSEGYYYKLDNYIYKRVPELINVMNNGCYTLKEPVKNKNAYLLTTYNIDNSPIVLRLVDSSNRPITALKTLVDLLGLKKEYVKRFKRQGFSGKSFDLCANMFNSIVKPVETGCYMDKKYNFYIWDAFNYCFKIDNRNGFKPGSAILSEYEFKDAKSVLRTDYDGAGLQNFNNLRFAV